MRVTIFAVHRARRAADQIIRADKQREAMLQMVKFTTGETCVIDRERGLRSAWMDWGDDDAPLANYSLDYDIADLPESEYRVLRDRADPVH